MANVIQVKRNTFTATGNPTALAYGELGWNNNNGGGGRLYVGSQRDDATPPVITEECLNKSVVGTSNEITVAEANTLFTVGLPDDVTIAGDLSVTGDVTVNDVSCVDVSADDITCDQLTATGNVVLGNATSDTVTIAGDLTVNGTTTTINSTTVAIDDLHFVVGADAADSSAANGAGLIVASDIAKLTYSHSGTKWVSSKPLDVTGTCTATAFAGPITGAVTGNASTATTLATARNIGGVSFDGSANIDLPGVNSGGNQNTSGVAATATILATARNIGGVSFNGSANINLPGVNSGGNQNTTGEAGSLVSTYVIDGGTFS